MKVSFLKYIFMTLPKRDSGTHDDQKHVKVVADGKIWGGHVARLGVNKRLRASEFYMLYFSDRNGFIRIKKKLYHDEVPF